jgi:hypothetical protein
MQQAAFILASITGDQGRRVFAPGAAFITELFNQGFGFNVRISYAPGMRRIDACRFRAAACRL